METLLVIILILALLGALPVYPYSSSWGYYPSGGLGLLVVIVILLVRSTTSENSQPSDATGNRRVRAARRRAWADGKHQPPLSKRK